LSNNLHIITELVKSEFKLRYRGSILGYLWTLIKPLLLFGVIYLVFSVFMRTPIANYQLYLLLGIIIWTFFSEATSVGLQSLLNNRDLITKIYFPRANIVLASVISSALTLLLNLIVFIIFYLASGFSLHFNQIIFLFYLVLLVIFTAAISLLLSILFTRYHDLKHIWEVLLQICFWLTPIVYDPLFIPEAYRFFLSLNPLAKMLSYSRNLFFYGTTPELLKLASLTIFCLGFFAVTYGIFRSQESKIAERI
jgi:lipopolysaccharide transport system permease protein